MHQTGQINLFPAPSAEMIRAVRFGCSDIQWQQKPKSRTFPAFSEARASQSFSFRNAEQVPEDSCHFGVFNGAVEIMV